MGGPMNIYSHHFVASQEADSPSTIRGSAVRKTGRACRENHDICEYGASGVPSATAAAQPGNDLNASIAAAQEAVERRTKALVAEFSPEVRVNAIASARSDALSTVSHHATHPKRYLINERDLRFEPRCA